MHLYLLPIIVLLQQCCGIHINITNGENNPQIHFDKPLKPPDEMMSDQGVPGSSDVLNGYIDFWSKYIYDIKTTPIPVEDMMNANVPSKVMNADADLISSNQPESKMDLGSSKELNQGVPGSSNELMSGYIDFFSKYIYDIKNATVPSKVMNEDADLISSNQPESKMDLESSKELNHLSDINIQDVIGVIENFTVNRLDSQVDVDVGPLEELNHQSNINTQDVSEISQEGIVNQPEYQVEVDVVDNQVVAQWVAALIFIIIALYAIVFIIAVAILECKGKGRRTTDDEKFGSQLEKQKLLNGAAISEDNKGYRIGDEFQNFDKSYTNAALQLESPAAKNYNHSHLLTDRNDLHHLLGSPVAEVEVFPQGSLQRPPKKGCLQY